MYIILIIKIPKVNLSIVISIIIVVILIVNKSLINYANIDYIKYNKEIKTLIIKKNNNNSKI